MSIFLQNIKNNCNKSDGYLNVKVIKAKNLALGNKKTKSINPYCVVASSMPYKLDSKIRKFNQGKKIRDQKGVDQDSIFQTSVIENDRNPNWNEDFEFYIDKLTTICFLTIEIWCEGPNKFLGYVQIPVSNSYCQNSIQNWFPLSDYRENEAVSGEINLKIEVSPTVDGLSLIQLTEENFDSIPEFIFKSFWNPHRLKKLDLVNCGIKIVSHDIQNLRNLEYLNLSNNKISSLPDSIGGLTKLIEIDVSNNLLESIPRTISKLNMLQYINIVKNNFTEDSLNELSENVIDECEIKGGIMNQLNFSSSSSSSSSS